MTLFTLVQRNIGRTKGRTALMVVAIAAAFLLYGLLAAMERNFSASDTPEAERRLIVSNRVGFTQPMPINYVDQIRSLPGVAAVTHRTLLGGYFRERRNLFVVVATDPGAYLTLYPEYQVSPQERASFVGDRNSVLVGESLADKFGWKVGQTVPINSTAGLQGEGQISGSYRIAGIFHATDRATGTGLMLLNYDAFNSGRVIDKDTVGSILILSGNQRANEALEKHVDSLFADSPYRTKTATEQEFGRELVAQLGNITLIVASVSGAGFFAILLIVASATATSVRQRQTELAVLRTLGFSSARIAGMILGEAVAITMLGGLIGLYFATTISFGLRRAQSDIFARMEVTPSIFAVAVLIMIGFAILGSMAPVIRTLRLPVSVALSRREG
jgi:putative ABC transport system permease protein